MKLKFDLGLFQLLGLHTFAGILHFHFLKKKKCKHMHCLSWQLLKLNVRWCIWGVYRSARYIVCTPSHLVNSQQLLNYLSWITSIIEFKEMRQSRPHTTMPESMAKSRWILRSEILLLQLVDYMIREEEVPFKYEDTQRGFYDKLRLQNSIEISIKIMWTRREQAHTLCSHVDIAGKGSTQVKLMLKNTAK